MKRIGIVFAALAVAALAGAVAIPSPLSAQSKKEKQEEANTRTLTGAVTDANDQPVELAVVQLKDMKTLLIRSYVTKKEGTYRFSGLSKDVDYQVKAEYQGASSGTKTLSVFENRPNPILNLKLDKK